MTDRGTEPGPPDRGLHRTGRRVDASRSTSQPAAGERDVRRRTVEELGFGALWFPESLGSKEAFSRAGVLLAATEAMPVATGIASIWARDAFAMANGARALVGGLSGAVPAGRSASVTRRRCAARGHAYRRPLKRMRDYLDAMDAARYDAPGERRPPRVLAALGDGMLRLAAERADGAHSYFVPVEHTARAREVLGPAPLLAVEQTAVLETDAGVGPRGRSRLRRALPRAAELREQPRAAGLRRGGRGRRRERPGHRRRHRPWGDEDGDRPRGFGSTWMREPTTCACSFGAATRRIRAWTISGASPRCCSPRGPLSRVEVAAQRAQPPVPLGADVVDPRRASAERAAG